MLLRSLIALCILLALALLYQNRKPYPKPVSSFDPALAVSAMAYRFPDNYNAELGFMIEPDTSESADKYKVFPDSVSIPASRVSSVLEMLLDGMNYKTASYVYYKTGKVPNGYDMALCHIPRFILNFRDAKGEVSNGYYICFECGNASFFNGSLHPKSEILSISKEGHEAFRKLQDRLFPE